MEHTTSSGIQQEQYADGTAITAWLSLPSFVVVLGQPSWRLADRLNDRLETISCAIKARTVAINNGIGMGWHTQARLATATFEIGLVLLAILLAVETANAASPASRGFDVKSYAADLIQDVSTRTLSGRESIELTVTSTALAELAFDVGDLTIDAVSMRGKPLAFRVADKKLRIPLPVRPREGRKLEIDVRYHGSPGHGLEFHPEAEQIYTVFSTSEWLVTVDAPDERATLDLSVALPETYRAIGNGALVSRKRVSGNLVLHRWRQPDPVPSFSYGFAAGRFEQVEEMSSGIALKYLSRTLTAEQSRRLFANTGDMLEFFGQRAGIPYRGKYDQVLVTKTIGQEVATFALLSEAYGQSTLAGETSEELIAHEVAHQWWGIGTTCRSWGEFWLNEGFATFMAAAYLQHRHGDGEYLASVGRWSSRVQKLEAEGKDHALVYEHWDKPSRDDRAVVYQKGAYVLHLLRQEVGEEAFWKGIRDYSQRFAGASVTTTDFQAAMEQASGRSLYAFFARWVHGKSFAQPDAGETKKAGTFGGSGLLRTALER